MELKMFVTDGFFHADLHPGNVRFGRNGQIVLLDLGMYGELSEDHRDRFLCYWLAAVQHQTKRAFYHLMKQTNMLPGADEEAYMQIILSGSKFGFLFPSELVLHAKALTTAEALLFTLVPGMSFVRETKPIVIRALVSRTTDPGRLKSFLSYVVPDRLSQIPGGRVLFLFRLVRPVRLHMVRPRFFPGRKMGRSIGKIGLHSIGRSRPRFSLGHPAAVFVNLMTGEVHEAQSFNSLFNFSNSSRVISSLT